MVLVFDLDDTLYDEASYVRGGFEAVARYALHRWELDYERSLDELTHILLTRGRGRVFNLFLARHNLHSQHAVASCVNAYRNHQPSISLFPEAERALSVVSASSRLYLVTDGHKLVQERKVRALGLFERFDGVFITHRFGRAAAKPATTCFEKIRMREKCDWTDLVHIADNPAKDFVGLNPLGAATVRVLTGTHRSVVAREGYDAQHTIQNLDALPEILTSLELKGHS